MHNPGASLQNLYYVWTTNVVGEGGAPQPAVRLRIPRPKAPPGQLRQVGQQPPRCLVPETGTVPTGGQPCGPSHFLPCGCGSSRARRPSRRRGIQPYAFEHGCREAMATCSTGPTVLVSATEKSDILPQCRCKHRTGLPKRMTKAYASSPLRFQSLRFAVPVLVLNAAGQIQQYALQMPRPTCVVAYWKADTTCNVTHDMQCHTRDDKCRLIEQCASSRRAHPARAKQDNIPGAGPARRIRYYWKVQEWMPCLRLWLPPHHDQSRSFSSKEHVAPVFTECGHGCAWNTCLLREVC